MKEFTIEEILGTGPVLYDLPKRRKALCTGKRTKMGFHEFMIAAFKFIEARPENRITDATLENRVKEEFAPYINIVRAMSTHRKKGDFGVMKLRHFYNRGILLERKAVTVPRRISLKWGIPTSGPEAVRMREWCRLNKGKVPTFVALLQKGARRALLDEEIREQCLFYDIRDDRFFTEKERTDSGWKKLKDAWAKSPRGKKKLALAATMSQHGKDRKGKKWKRKPHDEPNEPLREGDANYVSSQSDDTVSPSS